MALLSGARLGPYEILAPLGQGGMGEVYKARDTRLGRDVAIKVLPAVLAADPQFRERFEREGKSISQLNHPHICTLYDVGEAPGPTASVVAYMVMELLEGETLAARLTKGALPLADALRIAIEVAGALDKAHRQGIVHRDLKPGNIMLTKAGSKLLDFGLARMGVAGSTSVVAAAPTALATSPRPTLQSPPFDGAQGRPLTAQGTILGTFQYMSPEQVEGSEADQRSDIFAFGAVLFEMVTGQRAFSGKSQASLLAAILEREPPPISQLIPVAPPALDYLVRTCLAKDPDARFQTAHDLLLQLKWIAGEGSSATAQSNVIAASSAPAIAPGKTRERLAWIAAAVCALGLLVVGGWAVFDRGSARPPMLRLTIPSDVDKSVSYTPYALGGLALSPDGSTMVFRTGQLGGGFAQLYQRGLDKFEATPMIGTAGAYFPFFSPGGDWVAFGTSGGLKKVSIRGGAAFSICPLPATIRGASWGTDDFIYFAISGGPIQRAPAAGGAASPVTEIRPDEASHRWPQLLPGGKSILYTVWMDNGFDTAVIYAESLSTHQRKVVARGGSDGRYVSAGYVIYTRSEGLMAVPFDVGSLETTGPARSVVERVAMSTSTGHGRFAVSTDGILIYEPGADVSADASLVWVDRKGNDTLVLPERARYQSARLSPDGKRVAVGIADASGIEQLFVLDPARGTPAKRTFEGSNTFPAWTHDSARLTYMSTRADGTSNIYWRAADGSGAEERLTTDKGRVQNPNSWSGDGKVLTIEETGGGLAYLTMDGTPARHALLESAWNKDTPRISWDGKWLAYASAETGPLEIVVQPFPKVENGKYVVSAGGGTAPRWSRDGTELFYWAPPGKIMAVSVATTPSFMSSKPTMLFEGPYNLDYDVDAGGHRFLMIKESEQSRAGGHFNVIVNWFQELAKR